MNTLSGICCCLRSLEFRFHTNPLNNLEFQSGDWRPWCWWHTGWWPSQWRSWCRWCCRWKVILRWRWTTLQNSSSSADCLRSWIKPQKSIKEKLESPMFLKRHMNKSCDVGKNDVTLILWHSMISPRKKNLLQGQRTNLLISLPLHSFLGFNGFGWNQAESALYNKIIITELIIVFHYTNYISVVAW